MPKTKTTNIDLYETSVKSIRRLKEHLGFSSATVVLSHLLDELAEHPATTSPVTSDEKTISQRVEVTTSQRLQLLRSATKSPHVADVVAWLLVCYEERHAPAKHNAGEETFAAILAYLERKRKQKRQEKREQQHEQKSNEKPKSSQYHGISTAPHGKWRADLRDKKLNKRFFGYYKTELEALEAYEAKCKEWGVVSRNKLD